MAQATNENPQATRSGGGPRKGGNLAYRIHIGSALLRFRGGLSGAGGGLKFWTLPFGGVSDWCLRDGMWTHYLVTQAAFGAKGS